MFVRHVSVSSSINSVLCLGMMTPTGRPGFAKYFYDLLTILSSIPPFLLYFRFRRYVFGSLQKFLVCAGALVNLSVGYSVPYFPPCIIVCLCAYIPVLGADAINVCCVFVLNHKQHASAQLTCLFDTSSTWYNLSLSQLGCPLR